MSACATPPAAAASAVIANRTAHGECIGSRSEEHTSELQSLRHLVCRLLPPPASTVRLPLHDALPIWLRARLHRGGEQQPIAPVYRHVAEVGDPGGVHEAVNVRVRDPARRRRERCHSQPNGPRGVHWLSFTLCPKDMTGRVSVYLAISVNHAPVPIVDRR